MKKPRLRKEVSTTMAAIVLAIVLLIICIIVYKMLFVPSSSVSQEIINKAGPTHRPVAPRG